MAIGRLGKGRANGVVRRAGVVGGCRGGCQWGEVPNGKGTVRGSACATPHLLSPNSDRGKVVWPMFGLVGRLELVADARHGDDVLGVGRV